MPKSLGTSVEKAQRFHIPEVVSTQDEVRSRLRNTVLSAEEVAPWRVITGVTAEHQSAGRGRRGRKWVDPRGALLLSIGFADDVSEKDFPVRVARSAAAALLVSARSLFSDAPQTAAVKWPNDLLIAGRKAAGLLVETVSLKARLRGTILGIGVNVTDVPQDVPDAAALRFFSPQITVEDYELRFLRALDAMLEDPSLAVREYESGLILPAIVRTPKGEGRPVSYSRGVVTVETSAGRVELTDADIVAWEG
jgi:biotin-[acetyl-CoA-carboxylase] ligase BirA-like protein